jgi:hypothetical protein
MEGWENVGLVVLIMDLNATGSYMSRARRNVWDTRALTMIVLFTT